MIASELMIVPFNSGSFVAYIAELCTKFIYVITRLIAYEVEYNMIEKALANS